MWHAWSMKKEKVTLSNAWRAAAAEVPMKGRPALSRSSWPTSRFTPWKTQLRCENNPWHTMCVGTLFPVFPMNRRSLQQFASQNGQFNPWYGKHHLPSENLLPQNCGYQSMWESITWMPPSSPNWPWITGKTISTVIWRCLRNSGKDTKALAVLHACQNRR